MGLTIVQRILDTYGGQVWLDSEKGKGTTFYFSIPKKIEVSTNQKWSGQLQAVNPS